MNKRQFVSRRGDAWKQFEALLDLAEDRGLRKFSPEDTAAFSRLFRELSHDLSLIRAGDWGGGLDSYLNDLVGRGHNVFYSAPPGNPSRLARFLAVGFPRIFRRNVRYFV